MSYPAVTKIFKATIIPKYATKFVIQLNSEQFLWFYRINLFDFLNIFADFIWFDMTQRFATDDSIALNRLALGGLYLGGGS